MLNYSFTQCDDLHAFIALSACHVLLFLDNSFIYLAILKDFCYFTDIMYYKL